MENISVIPVKRVSMARDIPRAVTFEAIFTDCTIDVR